MNRSSSGKYKSKPPWDTTLYLSEWLIFTTQAPTDVGEDAEKEDLFNCWWGCKLENTAAILKGTTATLENSMEVPRKIKNRTSLHPSNCTTRYLSKGYRYAVSKGHMHPDVYSSTINNSQRMERAQYPSMNEWIKMWYIYTYLYMVIYIYRYIDIYTYICMYIHIYIHTHTHTHTHTMEYYLCIYTHIYHIFFIHPSVDGHLDSFHNLAIVNSTAINIGVHVPLWISIFVSFG